MLKSGFEKRKASGISNMDPAISIIAVLGQGMYRRGKLPKRSRSRFSKGVGVLQPHELSG
jgi:hypothetical protein